MKTEKKLSIILTTLGIVALVTVVILIIFGGQDNDNKYKNETASNEYTKEDQNRPKAVLSTKVINWNEIKLQDTATSEIELKNEGLSPLEITRMSTSCGCTSIQAVYNELKTKEYTMHKTSEKLTLTPNTTAKLIITYRPYSMPVEGAVTRQVFLETNDPVNPKLIIDASAVVRK